MRIRFLGQAPGDDSWNRERKKQKKNTDTAAVLFNEAITFSLLALNLMAIFFGQPTREKRDVCSLPLPLLSLSRLLWLFGELSGLRDS